jgi:hypothetical protein
MRRREVKDQETRTARHGEHGVTLRRTARVTIDGPSTDIDL